MAENNPNNALLAMFAQIIPKKSKNVTQARASEALYSKVSEGNYAFVKGLLIRANLQLDINTMYPIGGNNEETALMRAVRGNQHKIVDILLEHGANPNLGINNGTTPLMVAAQNGNLTILKALLDAGADLQAADADGATVLQWALSTSKGKESLGYLYERGMRAPELVPNKTIARPTDDVEVFDTLMASESTFGETYDDKDNILFKYNTQFFSIPRESLQTQLSDKESLRYECLIVTEGTPMENQVKMEEPFYILASAMRFTVPLAQINYIAQIPAIRCVEILDTARVLPSVTGRATIRRNNQRSINGENINVRSREHCNPGTEKKVFTLVAVDFPEDAAAPTEGGRRRKTHRRKRAYRKRSTRGRR
jgi:ankyrin repeat protein